jgi:RNA polymerase sigma-70 factor (ECF subfamily)
MGTALANAELDTAPEPLDAHDFDALIARHQSMVFSIAFHFLQDRSAAEELAQDVFLQLYRHLHNLQSADHVMFWLRRVTAHRCIDRGRRRHFKMRALDGVPEPEAPAVPVDPLLTRRLRSLIGDLPDPARIAVVLRYQEDLTPDEIARVLDRPVATVKSQLQRALKTLREQLVRVIGDPRGYYR